MKVVVLNGSPRLIGNTSAAVTAVLDELGKEGIGAEHIQVYGSDVIPCNDCGSCGIRGDGRCINENDDVNTYIEKIREADGLIIASPVYFGSMTSQLKMVLERIGYVSKASGGLLKRKVGAAIAVQGHHGGCSVLSEMTGFMLDNRMTVCGSSSLTVLTGRKPSEILRDKEGMTSLKDLGKEMAWLLYQLRRG